jgi:hypothetical protein
LAEAPAFGLSFALGFGLSLGSWAANLGTPAAVDRLRVAIDRQNTPPSREGDIAVRPARLRHLSRAGSSDVRPKVSPNADRAARWLPASMATTRRQAPVQEQPPQTRETSPMTERSVRSFTVADAAIRLAIVALILGTAYIHSTLGGMLFTLNALGYLVAAGAIVVPIAIASRFRWFIRIGLMGYAATAIVAWAIQGPYYSTAYLAKGIEIALITLLVVDFVRFDGNPLAMVRREIAAGLASVKARRTAPAAA